MCHDSLKMNDTPNKVDEFAMAMAVECPTNHSIEMLGIHSRKLTWIPKNDGLDAFKIWPFLVSLLDFWGAECSCRGKVRSLTWQ